MYSLQVGAAVGGQSTDGLSERRVEVSIDYSFLLDSFWSLQSMLSIVLFRVRAYQRTGLLLLLCCFDGDGAL